jgi:hypothetical protein
LPALIADIGDAAGWRYVKFSHDCEDLLGPWQENLASASKQRAAVLEELAALPNVVHRLGGSEAVVAIVTAVEDVARWWPDAPVV